MNKRIIYLDILAGQFILYMIFVHLTDWNWCVKAYLQNVFPKVFCIPFMGWFFFKAGMFHKQKSFYSTVSAGYYRLIKPFIYYTIIGHFFYCLRLYFEFHCTEYYRYLIFPLLSILVRGSANGNFALWFLFSLYLVKLITCPLDKKKKVVVFILILFFFLHLCMFIKELKIYNYFPLYLMNSSLGGIFYMLGYISKDYVSRNGIIYIAILCFVVLNVTYDVSCDFRTCTFTCNLVVYILSSFSFCVIVNHFFSLLPNKMRFLQQIGQNSMFWYVIHWPILTVSRLFFHSFLCIEEGVLLMLLQFLFIIIITICGLKYIPYKYKCC